MYTYILITVCWFMYVCMHVYMCVYKKCHVLDMHLYLGVGWRNWSQSFSKWQIWHWNHFGFLISIPGIGNILQRKKRFLIFSKNFFLHFSMFFIVLRVSGNFGFLFFGPFWKKVTGTFKNKKNYLKCLNLSRAPSLLCIYLYIYIYILIYIYIW